MIANVFSMASSLAVALLSLSVRFSLVHSLSMKSSNDSLRARTEECLPILCVNAIHVSVPSFHGSEATIDADVFFNREIF